MTVHVAKPLPECRECATPTRRSTYLANGGLCTPCQDAVDASVAHQLSLAGTDALERD